MDSKRFWHLLRNATMKSVILAFFLLSCVVQSNAQDSIVVCINVTDDERGEPIQNVTIQINGLKVSDQEIVRTYMKGISCFSVSVPTTLTLYFSHPLFNPVTVTKKIPKSSEAIPVERIGYHMQFL